MFGTEQQDSLSLVEYLNLFSSRQEQAMDNINIKRIGGLTESLIQCSVIQAFANECHHSD